MKINWVKKGKIFDLNKNISKNYSSHCANPTSIFLDKDIIRIFYNLRDRYNRSGISSFDFNLKTMKIISNEKKILNPKLKKNSFYSHGMSIGSIINIKGLNFLYFMGWKIKKGKHWFGNVGRLLINKKHQLKLEDKEPIIPLDDNNPISVSYPGIIKKKNKFLFIYGTTLSWNFLNNDMLHIFKSAETYDGKKLREIGFLKSDINKFQALSKPSIIKINNYYHMWFSYRGSANKKYKIGYAHSKDAYNWKYKINYNSIGLSNKGWDSEMIEYPSVLRYNRKLILLYNGNSYGKSGIGLAEAKIPKNWII
jgi:hypothetical protein